MSADKCNICGEASQSFLSVADVPPVQNTLCATRQQAIDFPRTAVNFLLCGNCRHISIKKEKSPNFDHDYNNDQTASAVGRDHLDCILQEIEISNPNREIRIVEIGCGRGELLSRLHARGYRNLAGYDPAAPDLQGGMIIKQLWDGAGSADVFILRHTLEEMPAVDEMVGQLAMALSDSGIMYLELTNSEHLIRDYDIFSLYPEYSNLFSVSSIGHLLQRHGIGIFRIANYFEGEWLGIWARKVFPVSQKLNMDEMRTQIRRQLRALPPPIALWGIGGRGGNILSFLGADCDLIPIAVDVSEAKQGLFVPPFGQQIVSTRELAILGPKTIIVSNSRYKEEIVSMMPEDCRVLTINELAALATTASSAKEVERQ